VTKPQNQMPLPLSPGTCIFLGSDVPTVLHKYESITAFTATGHSSRNIVVMLPYYCTEAITVMVMMMHSYVRRDWAVLKKEMLDAFQYTDSWLDSLVYTRQYLENHCAEYRGSDDTESVKSVLHNLRSPQRNSHRARNDGREQENRFVAACSSQATLEEGDHQARSQPA
jgi:hypothetical protein